MLELTVDLTCNCDVCRLIKHTTLEGQWFYFGEKTGWVKVARAAKEE
jgi:hypothetical protein